MNTSSQGTNTLVEDEDRVVLVEPGRQRIVVRRAVHQRRLLVRCAADQLQARRIDRHHEHQRHVQVLGRGLRTLAHEVVVGDRRRGRHHLGAGDDDAAVGLLLHRDVDVLHLFGRLVAVDRRIDDGVVHERHGFLRTLVPGAGIAGVRAVILRVAAESVGVGRLVVRRAAHPAIGQARPLGDRGLRAAQVLARARHAEVAMRVAAGAGVGGAGQHVAVLRVVQRVVEPRDGPDRIAQSGMGGHVLDALAVDIDLAAVTQALHVLAPV